MTRATIALIACMAIAGCSASDMYSEGSTVNANSDFWNALGAAMVVAGAGMSGYAAGYGSTYQQPTYSYYVAPAYVPPQTYSYRGRTATCVTVGTVISCN